MTPKTVRIIFGTVVASVCIALLFVTLNSLDTRDSAGSILSSVGALGITAIIVGGLFAVVVLAFLPGIIAAQRKHSKAEAIKVCSIVGLFFPPAWFVALVWAFTEDNSNKLIGYSSKPDRTLPTDEFGNRLRMP